MDTYIRSLESKGVIDIAYPADLRIAVERAVMSWRNFCRLPKEVRSRFPYNPGQGMGVGYERKEAVRATHDLKEDFHLTLASREWLMQTARRCNEPVTLRFVTDAEALIDMARPTIEKVARAIEEEFRIPGFGDDTTQNADWWFIRFLHYFGGRVAGEELAAAHADKSGFTLHLYESHPGLERLTHTGEWASMPVSEDGTAIIPGMRLQYRSENRIKATYHRVIATREAAGGGRFSAVCFVHPRNTPEYDKARAGRLQEFEPGFNYSMTWEDFSKLFKQMT